MAGAMSPSEVRAAVHALEISPSENARQSPVKSGGSKSSGGPEKESGFHGTKVSRKAVKKGKGVSS